MINPIFVVGCIANCGQTYIYFSLRLWSVTINLTHGIPSECVSDMSKNGFFFGIITISIVLLFSFVEPQGRQQEENVFTVVLDAGHGGHDPGNLGNGYLEKNIALDVVLKVGKLLADRQGIKVIYTRDDDTFVDLFKRGEVANKANADLFVSVHCNAHNSTANGAETYVLSLNGNTKNMEVAKKENSVIYLEDNYSERYSDYDLNSPEFVIGSTIMQEEFLDQSIDLAKKVQDNFVKTLKRKDRKVKQAAFIVLHQTFMPSVLVELGFLTNKSEGAYLNSAKGQREMSTAIANAIISYKDGVDANLLSLEPTDEPIVKQQNLDDRPTSRTIHDVGKDATVTKTESEEKKIKSTAEKMTGGSENIVFKVQLLASSKTIPLKPNNFKGLEMISKEPYKNMFRYMYGEAVDYDEAKKLKSQANAKGYTTSYIVAYKNGSRISLNEALKSM